MGLRAGGRGLKVGGRWGREQERDRADTADDHTPHLKVGVGVANHRAAQNLDGSVADRGVIQVESGEAAVVVEGVANVSHCGGGERPVAQLEAHEVLLGGEGEGGGGGGGGGGGLGSVKFEPASAHAPGRRML